MPDPRLGQTLPFVGARERGHVAQVQVFHVVLQEVVVQERRHARRNRSDGYTGGEREKWCVIVGDARI